MIVEVVVVCATAVVISSLVTAERITRRMSNGPLVAAIDEQIEAQSRECDIWLRAARSNELSKETLACNLQEYKKQRALLDKMIEKKQKALS